MNFLLLVILVNLVQYCIVFKWSWVTGLTVDTGAGLSENLKKMCTVHCSYILFCVHSQTNSSLVWKKNQNFDDLFSKPIPVWFGKKLQFWRLVFQTNSSLVWKKWPHFGSKKFQTNNNMDKGIMVSSVCHWLFLFETLLMWLYSMSRLTGRCTMRARMSARGSARCCIERWSWCLWSTWRQYRLLGVIEMVTGRCARLAWGGCGGCWWVVTKE